MENDYDIAVVKVGSKVISRESPSAHAKTSVLDTNRMDDLAADIMDAQVSTRYRINLVSSGAILAGREDCQEPESPDNVLADKQALAAIGQPILIDRWGKSVQKVDPTAGVGQLLHNPMSFKDEDAIQNLRNTNQGLIRRNRVPISNENDSEKTREITFGDNDRLAAEIANILRAKILILLSDIQGVFDRNPKDPNAKLIKEMLVKEVTEDFIKQIDFGKNDKGTGGISSKLESAKMAAEHGIPTVIAYGKEPRIISRILSGEKLGTLVKP